MEIDKNKAVSDLVDRLSVYYEQLRAEELCDANDFTSPDVIFGYRMGLRQGFYDGVREFYNESYLTETENDEDEES